MCTTFIILCSTFRLWFNVDAKDRHRQTPLLKAAERGARLVVWLVVEREDVEANAEDERGRTLLWWVAAYEASCRTEREVRPKVFPQTAMLKDLTEYCTGYARSVFPNFDLAIDI
jgi:hypothetical protein